MSDDEKKLFKELVLSLVKENFKLNKKVKSLEEKLLELEERSKKEYRKNMIKNIKH